MNIYSHIRPKTTVAIPLFRSAQFIDTIITNIECIKAPDVEILISDRHCYDDTIDLLAKRYIDDARVRCFKHKDKLDWVEHINFLLVESRGDFWRFLPHDDLSPPGSMEAMTTALEANSDAMLAYGPTKAIDGEGHHFPERDCHAPHPLEVEQGWTLGLVLPMFWKGYFEGAFKGLIRRKAVIAKNLLIRSTRNQIFPERCWLFALCLLGRFIFVPEATYVKRFYKGSTHTRWKITEKNFLSAAQVMCEYLHDLLNSEPAYKYGTQDLWLNARRVGRWQGNGWFNQVGERPHYLAAPDPNSDQIRSLHLPYLGD